MKRDMDLIRKILMACEENEHGNMPPGIPQIDGFSEEQIGYHVYLTIQAGLITGENVSWDGSPSPMAWPHSLTWSGHEFLEASRNEGLWAKAKEAAKSGGGMGLGVLMSVLAALATDGAKKALGLP